MIIMPNSYRIYSITWFTASQAIGKRPSLAEIRRRILERKMKSSMILIKTIHMTMIVHMMNFLSKMKFLGLSTSRSLMKMESIGSFVESLVSNTLLLDTFNG